MMGGAQPAIFVDQAVDVFLLPLDLDVQLVCVCQRAIKKIAIRHDVLLETEDASEGVLDDEVFVCLRFGVLLL